MTWCWDSALPQVLLSLLYEDWHHFSRVDTIPFARFLGSFLVLLSHITRTVILSKAKSIKDVETIIKIFETLSFQLRFFNYVSFSFRG